MWERVRNYNNKIEASASVPSRDGEAAAALISLSTDAVSKSPPPPLLKAVTPGSSIKKRKAVTGTSEVAKQSAIELLPEWTCKSRTKSTMVKRKKRTPVQVNMDNFETDAISNLRWHKYKEAHKGCTSEVAAIRSGPNNRKRGYGTRAVVDRWNANLQSPGQKNSKD